MKITWLGQAGLLFETEGKTVVVDPYLSDNVRNFEPKNYRRVPVDERFLKINPDVIVITHNHLDHLDKETTLKAQLTPIKVKRGNTIKGGRDKVVAKEQWMAPR